MLVSEITEKQFQKYLELQNSGIINMLDATRGSEIIRESRETYITIINNYTELAQKWSLLNS